MNAAQDNPAIQPNVLHTLGLAELRAKKLDDAEKHLGSRCRCGPATPPSSWISALLLEKAIPKPDNGTSDWRLNMPSGWASRSRARKKLNGWREPSRREPPRPGGTRLNTGPSHGGTARFRCCLSLKSVFPAQRTSYSSPKIQGSGVPSAFSTTYRSSRKPVPESTNGSA